MGGGDVEEVFIDDADRPPYPVEAVPGREIVRVPAVWDPRSGELHHCEWHGPGHAVHWIQAKQSGKDKDSPWLQGWVREVHEDGEVVLDVNGELVRLWNHHPSLVHARLRDNAGYAKWRPRWFLLTTPSPRGNYLFCVSSDLDDKTTCLR